VSMHRTTTTDDDDTRRLSLARALALAVLLGLALGKQQWVTKVDWRVAYLSNGPPSNSRKLGSSRWMECRSSDLIIGVEIIAKTSDDVLEP